MRVADDETPPRQTRPLWTCDVSAGGLYFHLTGDETFGNGDEITFELAVPPGEGYSVCEGRISGRGNVLRTESSGKSGCGVAVQFNEPLSLDF